MSQYTFISPNRNLLLKYSYSCIPKIDIKSWVTQANNAVIHEWALMFEWITIVQLRSDLNLIFKCSGSYTVCYIEFTLLFALILCINRNIVFHSQIHNDIFYCEDAGSVTSCSEIYVFSWLFMGEILGFFSLGNLSILWASMYEIIIYIFLCYRFHLKLVSRIFDLWRIYSIRVSVLWQVVETWSSGC